MRTYYLSPESFKFIHVSEHIFIENHTLELFTMMMLNSWYIPLFGISMMTFLKVCLGLQLQIVPVSTMMG